MTRQQSIITAVSIILAVFIVWGIMTLVLFYVERHKNTYIFDNDLPCDCTVRLYSHDERSGCTAEEGCGAVIVKSGQRAQFYTMEKAHEKFILISDPKNDDTYRCIDEEIGKDRSIWSFLLSTWNLRGITHKSDLSEHPVIISDTPEGAIEQCRQR